MTLGNPLSSSSFLHRTCQKNPYPSSGAIPSFGHDLSGCTKREPFQESSSKIFTRQKNGKFPADKFFFILDLDGGLKQYSMGNQGLVHDWGLMVFPQNFSVNMSAVNVSSDESLLILCSPDCDLEFYGIETKAVVDSYQGFLGGTEPFGIISTQNVRFLFIYTRSGYLKQFAVNSSRKLKRDYGLVHKDGMNCVALTGDDKF